ncbi:hypothetical protein F4780DRAFT_395522 [Xylariomycetidae sp. FL0641]|nr:hypothetical protein F4780DRAFT_395522 [Xylariomycetidae sp. FL0641]
MASAEHEADDVGYTTAALSLFILASRVVISRWRREPLDLSFWLVVASIVVVTARIVTNYYYLQFGTATQLMEVDGPPPPLTDDERNRLRTGSILVLLARVLITISLWLSTSILLVFYSRITSGILWVAYTIKATWVMMALTFIAVILSTFLECRPVTLYWETRFDPGDCANAYDQLLTQGVSNIVLDMMLLVVACPLISLKKRRWVERISLYSLFVLGTFCIVVTIVRVSLVFQEDSSQITRSVWASIQMFVSTFVANAPTIYGSLRVARRQRPAQRSATFNAADDTLRTRPSRLHTDSWIKIDEEIALYPVTTRTALAPLAPASTFYNEDTAPAPYSHGHGPAVIEAGRRHLSR